MDDCGTCINCTTRARWEALYKDYLVKNPGQEAWINEQKEQDKALICLNNKEEIKNYWKAREGIY